MRLGNNLRDIFPWIKQFHADLCPTSLYFIQDHTIRVVDQLGSTILVPTLFCSSWKVSVFSLHPLF